MDDYQFDERPCPKCGHAPTHWEECNHCEDGVIELYDEDPLYYDPDEIGACPECMGRGHHWWCPECGVNCDEWLRLNPQAEA